MYINKFSMLSTIRQVAFKVALIIFIMTGSYCYADTEAIIFDCDGVLVDTEYLKFKAWNHALAKYNIAYTIDEYLPVVGYSSEKIANEIIKQKEIHIDTRILIEEKNTIYKHYQTLGVPPIQEAVYFLKNLLANKLKYKIKIGLASSAPYLEILSNLKNIGVNPKDFDAIVSGEDDLKHISDPEGVNKPKPYIYEIIAQLLNVKPENCIVFEDTNAGVEAASAARMKVFGVPNTFTSKHDFSKAAGIITFKNLDYKTLLDQQLQLN